MSKATENILEFMSLTADIANNAADYRLKQNELDLINEEAQLKRIVAVNANEYKENLTAEKESSKASLQASLDSIDEYKDKLELYDVMQQDYLKLPEEYRTEDGKSTLDDLGIRHLGGYNFATKTANTLDEKLKYEENLTELMSEISRDSAEAYRNVLNLRNEKIQDLETSKHKGILDMQDYLGHIEKNPEIFRDAPTQDTNQDGVVDEKDLGELNYLARAFVSEKGKLKGVDYGFYDPAPEAAALKKVSSSLDNIEEIADSDWNNKVGVIFRDIESTEKQLKGENEKRATKGFFKQAGGAVQDYLGTSKMYENKDEALLLKGTLEEKIAKLISWGDSSMSEEEEGIANRAKLAIKNPNVRNDMIKLIVDKSLQSEPGQALYGIGWASEDMTNVDLSRQIGSSKQMTEETLLKKYMEAWRMIDNRFPGSTVDF